MHMHCDHGYALVEGDCHDSIRGVEGLFYTVTVMHVNVNVQDALVVLKQLQDGQHDVVDVAEARRLALLGVVQAAAPVDGHICVSVVQPHCAVDGGARVTLTEWEQIGEDGAVSELAHVEAGHEGAQRAGRLWRHAPA